MGKVIRKYQPKDEAFLRSIIFAEEDRCRYCGKPYDGGFRWFRNPNVIVFEHRQREAPDRSIISNRLISRP
jgi:hypothetical protein